MDPNNKIFQDEAIIFAAVDPSFRTHTKQGHIHFFPDANSLRLFRIERKRKDVLYLNEVADPKCKKCNGTARAGIRRIPLPKSASEIQKELIEYLRIFKSSKTPELVLENFITNMSDELGFPEGFRRPLRILMDMLRKDFIEEKPIDEITLKYAEMLKRDFEPAEVVWCECFVTNLEKEIKIIKQQTMFSIN